MRSAKFCNIALVILLLFVGHIPSSFAQEQVESRMPHKFDEFGNITCEDELARLDAFTMELLSNPNLQGYIIVYGGRRGRRSEAKARAARMKFYLVRVRGLDAQRILTMDGGYREELSGELWLMMR